MTKTIVTIILTGLFSIAHAQSTSSLPLSNSLPQANTQSAQTTKPEHNGMHNQEVDKALSACASSASKDTNGRPDHTAMSTCMQSKGFTPPPKHDGERGSKRPDNTK